jgi:hypothetical protein
MCWLRIWDGLCIVDSRYIRLIYPLVPFLSRICSLVTAVMCSKWIHSNIGTGVGLAIQLHGS